MRELERERRLSFAACAGVFNARETSACGCSTYSLLSPLGAPAADLSYFVRAMLPPPAAAPADTRLAFRFGRRRYNGMEGTHGSTMVVDKKEDCLVCGAAQRTMEVKTSTMLAELVETL